MTDVLVITGLSGAGRSQAADDLEDLGWFVVDNLPIELLDKIVELGAGPNASGRLGLVVGP
ncbi:MAG: RNase adapter RapZ, partial [Ilumatobacteraceae bacterium]